MLVSKENITAYIPQKEPFILVHRLMEASKEKLVSEFVVEEDCPLLDGDELKEVGCIENMAQTVAAGFTYIDKEAAGEDAEPKIGFIGSVNKFVLNRKLKVNETLTTEVIPQMSFENITLVEASIYSNDELIASCELKIAIVDDLGL